MNCFSTASRPGRAHLAYWYFLRPEGGQCQSLNSQTLPVPTLLCPWFKIPWMKLSDHCQIPKGYWKRPSYQIFKLSRVVKSKPFWEHGDYSINACWLNKGIQTFTQSITVIFGQSVKRKEDSCHSYRVLFEQLYWIISYIPILSI